jgi:hypothetical protein
LGGKPLEAIVKDITLQNIVDWLIPDFKERDDKLKSHLLKQMNKRREEKGTLKKKKQEVKSADQSLTSAASTAPDINFEFKLLVFAEEDQHLRLPELPKKLKLANKQKTILTVKKHIHNYTKEPIDNIEILCKNFPVADSHSLEYIKRTKWQNNSKVMILQYKRKKRIIGNKIDVPDTAMQLM